MEVNPFVAELDKVSFERGERMIFKNLNMQIKKGQITAIMGPSGTGKTTLLHLLGGLLLPSRGQVQVLGRDTRKFKGQDWLQARKRMGMLFQSGALFNDLSVFDNVAFALREHTHLPEAVIADIVKMKLEAVGLRGSESLMPAELSGGMGRRIALARAMSLDPEMMLYDEPFAGQDPISMGVLLKLIRTLNDSCGLTSILVSHDVHEVLEIADQIFIISGGKVIGQGSPAEIRKDASALVKQFIAGEPDGPVAFRYPAALSVQDDFLGGADAR